MRDDIYRFLSVNGRLPARVTADQAGWLLNCQPHNIPVLVAARLLKPLGNPPANAVKYFATDEILELSKDKTWLWKSSNAMYRYWRDKNNRRSSARSKIGENMESEIEK